MRKITARTWRVIRCGTRRAGRGGAFGVAPEELLTNGMDEAIHLICETYLETGDEAIIVGTHVRMYRDLRRRDRGESHIDSGSEQLLSSPPKL